MACHGVGPTHFPTINASHRDDGLLYSLVKSVWVTEDHSLEEYEFEKRRDLHDAWRIKLVSKVPNASSIPTHDWLYDAWERFATTWEKDSVKIMPAGTR